VEGTGGSTHFHFLKAVPLNKTASNLCEGTEHGKVTQ